MSIHVDLQNAMVTAAAAELPSGSSLVVYDGTAPANVNTALSGNNVLATFTTAGWGATSAGSVTASAIASVTASASGTATFVRCLVGGVSKYQANVGGAVTIDVATIAENGTVNITGWTLTQPAA
jgi:hypothetical protein